MDGFKLTIERGEMRLHLEDRARHHSLRADDKERELPSLKQSLATIKGATAVGTISKSNYCLDTNDPVEKLEHDIAEHRAKAHYFTFAASHLGNADEFVLTDSELSRLEFVRMR